MVDHGWVVACVNYRFSTQAPFPACLADVRAAVRALHARASEYVIDQSRVIVTGDSAGGHLSLLAGLAQDVTALDYDVTTYRGTPAPVHAVINRYGPTDLTRFFTGPGSELLDWSVVGDPDYITQLLGADASKAPNQARSASPISYVQPSSVPVYTIHGDADQIVPVAQARWLHAALDQAGVWNRYREVPGGGHGSVGDTLDNVSQAIDAISAHLGWG